eukprot:TRINITY_DN837_c0_g1_i1.p1 TRINITY_DN837_c0_g1~~TRINITY_DN837_c0_g1_i1.p1  ORF type:complete len:575 (-),score=85.78 TRINITY_DN837_c0_g1_i1:103-1587(-)
MASQTIHQIQPYTSIKLYSIHAISHGGERVLVSQSVILLATTKPYIFDPPLPPAPSGDSFSFGSASTDGLDSEQLKKISAMFDDTWKARWAFDPLNPPASVAAKDVALARRIRGERDDFRPSPQSSAQMPSFSLARPQQDTSSTDTKVLFMSTASSFSGFSSAQSSTMAPQTSSAGPPTPPFWSGTQPVSFPDAPSSFQPSESTSGLQTNSSNQPMRYRPGTVALAEIRRYQHSALPEQNLINKIPFQRLLREIFQDMGADMKIQSSAVQALSEAAEAFLVGFMEDANLVAIQDKMVTVLPDHMRRAMRNRAAAAGVTIPDGPITSANILRLVYGMEMKEDHDGDSEDEESDEGGDHDSSSDGDNDAADDASEPKSTLEPSESALNAPATFAIPEASGLGEIGAFISDRLMEYLLKIRDSQDKPLNMYWSSADYSHPVIVAIEDLRSKIKIPDSVNLRIYAELETRNVVFDPVKSVSEQCDTGDIRRLVLDLAD